MPPNAHVPNARNSVLSSALEFVSGNWTTILIVAFFTLKVTLLVVRYA